MKRLTAVFMAVVLMAGMLAGCGNKGSAADTQQPAAKQETDNSQNADTDKTEGTGQVTIQWWTPNWDEPESREMAAEFEKENPDIKVELVITDWDTYKSKITTAISAKNAPELFTILLTDVGPFAKKDLLEPLSELGRAASIDFDDLLEPALAITSLDDEIYGIPFRYDGSGIYYNVDMLKEAGYESFPTDWDEMAAMSKELSGDGVYGFAWPLGNQANAVTRLVQQLYTYGGDILNEDETKCLLDSDAAKKALGNIVNSISEGYASPSSAEIDNTKMREMFASGQIAFNFTGPFDVEPLRSEYPDLNFKTAVIPANGWCVSMAKNSENKEAAARFLAYITTPENQARLTDSFPASKTAIEYEQFSEEALKPFTEQLNNSKAEPTYENWAEMEPVIYQYIQNAVSGNMTVEQACEGMTADIDALLAF